MLCKLIIQYCCKYLFLIIQNLLCIVYKKSRNVKLYQLYVEQQGSTERKTRYRFKTQMNALCPHYIYSCKLSENSNNYLRNDKTSRSVLLLLLPNESKMIYYM